MSTRVTDVADMPSNTIACRDEGHRWLHITDEVTYGQCSGQVLNYTQVRQCGRCGCVRRRTISVPSFRVHRTTYVYPDGYLFQKGRAPEDVPAAIRSIRLNAILASR